MKKQYVADIKTGDKIDDIFVIVDQQIGRKKDNNIFASMVVSDKTGRAKAVIWNNVEQLLSGITTGDFVRIIANVGEYQGTIQLVLKDIKLLSNEEGIDYTDFLPVTVKNIDRMFNRLRNISNSIENFYLKQLFELFWGDAHFVKQFKLAPAAKRLHHAYIGGLLEHTLSMALIGEQLVIHYNGVDRDLLIAGIILHDIGKIRELSCKGNIEYTDEGRFLSHIVIGVTIISEKIEQIHDFPEKMGYMLKHLIVSHHGAKEFGSPEVPKTMEATLLNCIDDMDFRVNNIREYIDADTAKGDWTLFNKFMGRHFYKNT